MNRSQLSQPELRLRISRLRRRIDRRGRRVGTRVGRLVSWREFCARHPGYAAMASAGAGLALAAALRRGRLVRWLGVRLVRETIHRLGATFLQVVGQAWEKSK